MPKKIVDPQVELAEATAAFNAAKEALTAHEALMASEETLIADHHAVIVAQARKADRKIARLTKVLETARVRSDKAAEKAAA